MEDRIEDMEESIKGIHADMSPEDVSDTMRTVLAFYGSSADCCRRNKAASVQAWARTCSCAFPASGRTLRPPVGWARAREAGRRSGSV